MARHKQVYDLRPSSSYPPLHESWAYGDDPDANPAFLVPEKVENGRMMSNVEGRQWRRWLGVGMDRAEFAMRSCEAKEWVVGTARVGIGDISWVLEKRECSSVLPTGLPPSYLQGPCLYGGGKSSRPMRSNVDQAENHVGMVEIGDLRPEVVVGCFGNEKDLSVAYTCALTEGARRQEMASASFVHTHMHEWVDDVAVQEGAYAPLSFGTI
ncbi:hypothetical protein BDN70DRAFT_900815 [Pholiota conissans]|uniref:Uncharacterized protein n=1 Tax=Pholiota conissans TaxID=109636 RepID=A0A9P6CTG8_9AGAR|nr:hypothetical protein BDN70DRAFT_900815 [Pholiota conissans]